MSLLPDRPLPATQLVRLIFHSAKQSLPVVWPGLLLILLFAGAAFFYNAFYNVQLIDLTTGEITKGWHFFISMTYPILLALLLFWLYLYMLNQTQLNLLGKSWTNKAAIGLTNQRYLHFLLTGIASIAILFCLSALILPYLFFFPILVFVPISSAIGRNGFLEAFKQAWLLVWGNWWHTLFVLLLSVIAPLFILGALAVGVSYLVQSTLLIYIIITIRLTALLLIFFISINALLILYHDLRLRRLAQPT